MGDLDVVDHQLATDQRSASKIVRPCYKDKSVYPFLASCDCDLLARPTGLLIRSGTGTIQNCDGFTGIDVDNVAKRIIRITAAKRLPVEGHLITYLKHYRPITINGRPSNYAIPLVDIFLPGIKLDR